MAESIIPQIYVDLARELVDRVIEPSDFMMRFLEEFKAEKRFFDEPSEAALNALFAAAEGFVEHPSSMPDVVDEEQLRDAARDFLRFAEAQDRDASRNP